MADTLPSVEQWTEVVRECASNVGPAMGLAPCQVLGTLKLPAMGLSGVAVALEHDKPIVLIGVLSNRGGRAAIARAVFKMAPSDSPTPEDETDAVGELANVISGQVKAAMRRVDARMRVGLPYAMNADAFAAHQRQVTLRVSFGSVPAALVVTLL